jgi:hypothetical protein
VEALGERLAHTLALTEHPLLQIGTKVPQIGLRLRVGHQLGHPHPVGGLADEQHHLHGGVHDACNGPWASVPAAIWKVVDLAATSAGDVGITYAPPGRMR